MKQLRAFLEDYWGRIVLFSLSGILGIALVIGVFIWRSETNAELGTIHRENTNASLNERVEDRLERERLIGLYNQAQKGIEEVMPGFLFIGDDFTAGRGGGKTDYAISLRTAISDNLYTLLDFESVISERYRNMAYNNRHRFVLQNVSFINFGVSEESTDTTLAMNGGTKIVLTLPVTIEKEVTAIRIDISAENGDRIYPLLGTDIGTAQVILGEINGTLSRVDVSDETDPDYPCYYRFMRDREGEAQTFPAGTEIVTQNSLKYRDYYLVIMMGVNGGYDSPEELVAQHQALIDTMTDHADKYFVIGLPFADDETELAMKTAFGDKFLSTRDYFTSEKALEDSNVIKTSKDTAALEGGSIPPSLLNSTGAFLGSYGYTVLGQELYRRMDALGYFDECKAVISDTLAAVESGETFID